MSKISLRQKIISELIKNRELSVAKLTEKLSTSRVSISKEIQILKERKLAEKKHDTTSYILSPSIAFVIFKFYHDSAELVSYSLDGSVYERESIDLLYSLPYEDNVIFLAQRIEKCAQFLKKKFERVFTCMIHDKKLNSSHPIYKTFEFMDKRAELIARHIAHISNDESVLYINTAAPISFVCKQSEAVTPNAYPTQKALNAPQGSFSLIRPSKVILEGNECEAIVSSCAKNDIPLRFVNSNSKLFFDELELIEEVLYKLSKETVYDE